MWLEIKALAIAVLVVAGTPGTGKTSVARELARRLGAEFVDLSEFALERGLVLEYDEESQSYVVDEERLVEGLARFVAGAGGKAVVATHYPEILPPDMVELVAVLRLDPRELERRLRGRGWPERKVRENVMAEVLGVVAANALEAFGEDKVVEVDATGKGVEEVVEEIVRAMTGPDRRGARIDWLDVLAPEEVARYEWR
ncbi:MAG: AAA family ATPase [Desulfurococcaceae archaeon]